ncbi:hypothetical protein FS837_007426 [Tulasnella sp. UAMH 9824]|nr:hypothetical protein FS837_007426 [Tulasnella sp. UAMH 9824]
MFTLDEPHSIRELHLWGYELSQWVDRFPTALRLLHLTDEVVRFEELLAVLEHSPSLGVLVLDDCNLLADEEMLITAGGIVELQFIMIDPGQMDLFASFIKMPALTSLSVAANTAPGSNDFLVNLLKSSKEILSIDICDYALTADDWLVIIKHLPNLTRDLRVRTSYSSDEDLQALTIAQTLPNLTSITLDNELRLTTVFVEQVARAHPKLESVVLRGWDPSNVSADSLAAISKLVKNIFVETFRRSPEEDCYEEAESDTSDGLSMDEAWLSGDEHVPWKMKVRYLTFHDLSGRMVSGLFAGVNSTFLALTLPQMKPDPADDTNALLLQVAKGGNGTIQSSADLPSASFSPPPGIYPVNVLLSMSLTLALLSSFLAVLGQQWLVQYRKRSGGGAEHQRWEQLRRYLGAKRWRLEPVLDDVLPGLLQLAMIIFCISFSVYLSTLNHSMCIVITTPIGLVVAILLVIAGLAAWDQWCPFKSPLSHAMQVTLVPFIRISGRALISCYCALARSKEWTIHRLNGMLRGRDPPAIPTQSPTAFEKQHRLEREAEMWYETLVCRPPESIDQLKLIALKRVIAISEDPGALTYAALNICSIYKKEDIRSLINDVEFLDRLRRLSLRASDGGIRLAEGKFGSEQARVIGTSFLYLLLSGGSILDLLPDTEQADLATSASGDETAFLDFFESAHCVELKLCGGLMAGVAGWALSTRAIYLQCLAHAVQKYKGRGSPQLLCILSTLVSLLSEGSNERHGRIQSASRKTEILCSLPDIYSATKQASQMGQLVGTAIATSASVWAGRPGHEVYVYLFKEGCFLADLYGRGLENILENAGSLLISIEESALNVDATSSEGKG